MNKKYRVIIKRKYGPILHDSFSSGINFRTVLQACSEKGSNIEFWKKWARQKYIKILIQVHKLIFIQTYDNMEQ